jgi:hypothetical protein
MPPIATKNGEPLKRRRASGNNFSNRFPQIVAALPVLPVRSTRLVSHRPHRRSVNKRLTKDEARRMA